MVTDYTRDEESILIALIREKNPGQLLTGALVTFGFPNVHTPTPQRQRNTVIVATSVPGRMYTGSQAFYYNRVDISKFPDPRLADQTVFIVTDETKLSDLLPAINARYRINLTPDKIIDVNIPDFVSEGKDETQIELRPAPSSKVFIESLMLTVRADLIPLSSVIVQGTMDGLTYQAPA